jgi:hypothetical protein
MTLFVIIDSDHEMMAYHITKKERVWNTNVMRHHAIATIMTSQQQQQLPQQQMMCFWGSITAKCYKRKHLLWLDHPMDINCYSHSIDGSTDGAVVEP